MHSRASILTRSGLALALAVAFLAPSPAARAAGPEHGFLDRTYTGPDGKASKYVIYVPDHYDGRRPTPAILFLHGAGERGTDGHRQVAVGLGPFVRVFQKQFPFIVVFPQAEKTWRADSPDARRALAILDQVEKEYRVDLDRVYLTGLSMGGFGTWSIAARDPGRFAAIVPVCGGPAPAMVKRLAAQFGGDPAAAASLKDLPAWIFQGSADPVVRPEWARQMVAALKKAGGHPRYSEFPYVGHDSWNPAYATWELYPWLLEQRRAAHRPSKARGTAPAARGAVLKPPAPTGLGPARLLRGLGSLHEPITTTSTEAQAFFDQGLDWQHSFVYLEAARSFERAAQLDPDCAMAYWGLSRALEALGKPDPARLALAWAGHLASHASDREQKLIRARVLEKAIDVPPNPAAHDARMKQVRSILDELIAVYPDDQEVWMQRAAAAETTAAAIAFYLGALRLNPRHPGASHHLVHAYEGIGRAALGWEPSETYRRSAVAIPHAHHMQAHLAMRLARWETATQDTLHCIELERAYHRDLKVKPTDDAQYPHHLDICTRCLIHGGRYREAEALRREVSAQGIDLRLTWARLDLAQRHWSQALEDAARIGRSGDPAGAAYIAALADLGAGDVAKARPEVDAVAAALRARPNDSMLQYYDQEIRGLLGCATGHADEGLKLLGAAAERSKTDYGLHSYGGGAYFLEAYGQAALGAGQLDVAEEALLEALAHDAGSAVAALGLQAISEARHQPVEARNYAALARRLWARADPGVLDRELAALRIPRTESAQTAAIGPKP